MISGKPHTESNTLKYSEWNQTYRTCIYLLEKVYDENLCPLNQFSSHHILVFWVKFAKYLIFFIDLTLAVSEVVAII